MTYASCHPLTEAEQEALRQSARAMLHKRQIRRKATPSGQDYEKRPTPALRAITARRIGEALDGE